MARRVKTANAEQASQPQIEMVSVDVLREHPSNPRKGNVAVIAASIKAHGFFGAVLVQRSTNYILAGNHRYRAAKEAGLSALPVLYVDKTDDEALRILLADNRTSDLAHTDDQALLALLSQLEGTNDLLVGTGYNEDDLQRLVWSVEESQRQCVIEADDRTTGTSPVASIVPSHAMPPSVAHTHSESSELAAHPDTAIHSIASPHTETVAHPATTTSQTASVPTHAQVTGQYDPIDLDLPPTPLPVKQRDVRCPKCAFDFKI